MWWICTLYYTTCILHDEMESNLIAEKIIAGLIQLKEYFNGANVVDHLPIDIFFAYDFNEHTKCN